MNLLTDRLSIRYFREDDIDAYAPIVADPDVMKFLDGVQTRSEAITYLGEMIEHHATSGLGRYAVELRSTGELIGFCGFRPAGNYVDFGYRYAKHTRGQGIGREAALAVREYGIETLNMTNMEAGVAQTNLASTKILDELGFRHREELIF